MRSLSSVDYHYLVQEWQSLVNARLDKVFQPALKEFFLQFHVTGKGKQLLRILLPQAMYLSAQREPAQEPKGLCMFLRKKLGNARLLEITQPGFQRVIQFTFTTKTETYYLIIELFSKGNLVLCDKDYQVLGCLTTQAWKNRAIKVGQPYLFPEQISLPDLSEQKLIELVKTTTRNSLVTFLAIDLALGGIYAEELCARTGFDKHNDPRALSKQQLAELFKQLTSISKHTISPRLYYEDKYKSRIMDYAPFALESYHAQPHQEFMSYNESLDILFQNHAEFTITKKSAFTAQMEKLATILVAQEEQLDTMEKEIEVNKAAGNFIYEHYQDIKNILEEFKAARKKYSASELKAKLKEHKILKEYNDKEGKIIIEL